MSDSTVLVTGGAGFIGSHVVDALIARGERVVALDDLSGGFVENHNPAATLVQGSILDHALIDRLFAEHRFEKVFHLAAYAAEGLSHFIRRYNYQTNLVGSVNLLNAAVNAGTRCFVYTSSIAVYGAGQTPMTEDLIPRPEDPYGIAKYAFEQDLHAAKEMFGIDSVIFRPHNVYGERQNIGDRYRNVIGIFFNNILQGKPLPIFGDGSQTRAFSYIADVAPVIAESAYMPQAYGHAFNVGADTAHSVNDLAHAVAEAMGVRADITYFPERLEVKHAVAGHEKVRQFFGDRPQTSLRDGLAKMAAFVRRYGPRQSRSFENIEVRKNLPRAWSEQGTAASKGG